MAYVDKVIPLVITSLLFTIIAGILVLTRVITRARIGIIGVDDYLALGALVSRVLPWCGGRNTDMVTVCFDSILCGRLST